MHIDFDSLFRNQIESLLIKSSWVKAVQERLGLEAVSQVWSERPEWYFWIRGAPGAYSLALADADGVNQGDCQTKLGRFAVKCYPYPRSDGLAGFSTDEQAALCSDLFDHTHTPRIEAKNQMPDDWFTVGSVSISMRNDPSSVLLTYDSLDRIRSSCPASTHGDPKSGRRIFRNVRGWEMGYRLFDCLVGLFAFYTRNAPCFAGTTCSQGFEYLLKSDQKIVCKPAQSTRKLAFSVLFAEKGRLEGQAEAYWRRHLDPDEITTYAGTLPDTVESPIKLPAMAPAAVNPAWWDLAHGDFKSDLASTCGCGDHDHLACSEHTPGDAARS